VGKKRRKTKIAGIGESSSYWGDTMSPFYAVSSYSTSVPISYSSDMNVVCMSTDAYPTLLHNVPSNSKEYTLKDISLTCEFCKSLLFLEDIDHDFHPGTCPNCGAPCG